MTLFSTRVRDDFTPMRAGEGPFSFYDRSATKYAAYVRELLDGWLRHVPSDKRHELVQTLKGAEDAFESALWELYLHEGFRRSGYGIEIHPAVQGPNRPDFCVEGPHGRIYVEAIRVGRSTLQVGDDRRLADVHRVLEELRVTRFSIGVEHFAIGPSTLATKRLKAHLRAWLATLDPTAVIERYDRSAGAFDWAPTTTWTDAGWRLEFQALPLKAEVADEEHSALGMRGPGEAEIVDNVSGIRRALDRKRKRYGVLNAPLTIAVLSNTTYPTKDYEAEQALFGETQRRPNDPLLFDAAIFTEGHWVSKVGWRHGELPTVVTAHGVRPSTLAKRGPRSWTTLEPATPTVPLPTWIVPMSIGERALPAYEFDLATFFDIDATRLADDSDFAYR